MEVRGGGGDGGATALSLGYGYEACNARHDKTFFPIASEFYMNFLGPLQFIHPDGSPRAVVGWAQAQELWQAQTGGQRKAAAPAKVRQQVVVKKAPQKVAEKTATHRR